MLASSPAPASTKLSQLSARKSGGKQKARDFQREQSNMHDCDMTYPGSTARAMDETLWSPAINMAENLSAASTMPPT